ncbi:hypothetical protein FF38_12810 [Lucilia cuprina]|uniref:Uncharacterized protein n=1 Tax=Lucilia cuprina TaxID=7375 RepID=A0A0L0CH69_LUCCU|nr:hypothetical protein FF38_12810 [Lucilia cuprina]
MGGAAPLLEQLVAESAYLKDFVIEVKTEDLDYFQNSGLMSKVQKAPAIIAGIFPNLNLNLNYYRSSLLNDFLITIRSGSKTIAYVYFKGPYLIH